MMSEVVEFGVPADLVATAIQAAKQRGVDVADVPLVALAEKAGISRSTLLRRIGGSRRTLDNAVRAAGVDPGGRRPVRERAVEAAAGLISERGLVGATLEAVADAAECSVHSLYAAFGGRDELLGAVYERYSPLRDLEDLVAEPRASFADTVHAVYAAMAASFTREPRVVPAMLADLFSRPNGPSGRIFQRYYPRALDSVGGWLAAEVQAGRIRTLPVPLLIQQLLGPLAVHLLFRPAMEPEPGGDLPTVEETCAVLADAFLRAVAVPAAKAPPDGRSAPSGAGRKQESES
jgi:AcrR family transcriptional regulator